MMRLRRILVPVDFTRESELAVEWAVRLGREESGATIFLLHVLLPTPVIEGGFEVEQILEKEWEIAQDQVDELRGKIPPPLSSVALVAKGEESYEIANVCEKENIDLVIMTTHGRHGLSRLVHPNVSEKVVRNAPCPVLVLHLNAKTEGMLV